MRTCTYLRVSAVLGWSLELYLPVQTATSAYPSRAVCLGPANHINNPSAGVAERPWKACGMDCWLDKPVNQAKLRDALARLEAGAPLLRDWSAGTQGCAQCGAEGVGAAADGLSQPARCSLRPLGDMDLAAVRAARRPEAC